jgi:putative nucleotidyltransferase with HDIG domain
MRYVLHLARRFFRSLVARRPDTDDQVLVGSILSTAEADVFWSQPIADQDHAMRVARRVLALAPDRSDLARAGLLHDIGKRHARIGTTRRSIATALRAVRLPVGPSMERYLDHAEVGASELTALGADDLSVAFARHHHGERPPEIDEGDWLHLVRADDE